MFLAEEQFAGGIQHGDGRNTAIEGHIVLLGEVEVLLAMADVHVDDHKIFLEGGGDFGAVKGVVEGVAVAAPIGPKDDENTFVRGRGGMKRFRDFLFGVDTGGVEIFTLGRPRQSRSARGCGEGQSQWMQKNQEQYEWKSVHRKPVSGTWNGGVNERKGVEEPCDIASLWGGLATC